MRRSFILAAILFLSLLLISMWRENHQPKKRSVTPSLTGKPEYCITCHSDLPEISPSHPVNAFGCVICHGGEALALDANLAHSSMLGGKNPSDLSFVQESCGGNDCHSGDPADQRDHIHRVLTSIQATYAGALANVLYTFGQEPDLTPRYGIYAIQSNIVTSPKGIPALQAFMITTETPEPIKMFATNCLYCHLSASPFEDPQYYRLTGCAACHTPTSRKDPDQPLHQLTTAIPYTQCNTCHNRGNYDLRLMEFIPRQDHPHDRLHDYYQPIAQFVVCEWTLDCIDCHTRQEAMGDGNIYGSKFDVQYVQCKTCHGTLNDLPRTKTITDPEDLALKLAFLDPVIDLKVGDTIIMTNKGEPLWNTRQLPDGNFEEFGKATGKRLIIKPVKGTGCLQKSNQQESRYCHVCHSVQR
jgi:hypothetical protein